ncbi:TetR family transcriptional regulator [Epibacterium sp. SM1979]|uniref:TetR family transcriptional regulator n=1 Tax=Tritonibacter litoralis TaxID=2662264 RepID=A0A843YCB2_9RHOB|nr:TetR/AcrR family transcriptional regulator [Tritonibacter litoralis]MQQ08591.1 TetR family transcriptional regulator [Tritonibacter litoralis]
MSAETGQLKLDKPSAAIQRTGRKFDQVLEGARKLFMSKGFERTSVDDIAREASVSKATLYSYFPDKRLLFSEVVRTECQRQSDLAGDPLPPGCAPEKVLYSIARQVMGSYTSEISQQMFRVCVAEAKQFPELGELFYQSGPMAIRNEVRAYLETATDAGQLRVEDYDTAADQFVELCKADLLLRAVFLNERDFPEADFHRVAAAAVDLFLARFGVSDT